MSAIAEHTRLRILALCAGMDLTVSELQQVLAQSQPRISRHLKILCDAGLLTRRREGAWTYYRMRRRGAAAEIAQGIVGRVPAEDPVIADDLARLGQVRESRRQAADAYFRANADQWDEVRALHGDVRGIEARLLDVVETDQDARLLDIGTGTGRMLQLFAPRISYGLGIDLSHDMLTVARVNLDDPAYANCEVRHGDMYRLPADPGSFDIALLHMVLHYAEYPEEVLREAVRALKPGGRLVLVDFAPHGNEDLLSEHAHRWLGFDDERIAEFFAQAGLGQPEKTPAAPGALSVVIWSARRAAGDLHHKNAAATSVAAAT